VSHAAAGGTSANVALSIVQCSRSAAGFTLKKITTFVHVVIVAYATVIVANLNRTWTFLTSLKTG